MQSMDQVENDVNGSDLGGEEDSNWEDVSIQIPGEPHFVCALNKMGLECLW